MNGFRLFFSTVAFTIAVMFGAMATPASATLLGDEIDIMLGGFTDTVTVTNGREIEVFFEGTFPNPCNICNDLASFEWIDVSAASARFHFVRPFAATFTLSGLEPQGGFIIIGAINSNSTGAIGELQDLNFDANSVMGGFGCDGPCDIVVDLRLGLPTGLPNGIPEPASAGLFGLGVIALAAARRRRKSA